MVERRRGFGYIRKLPSGRYQASYLGPDQVRHNAPITFEAKIDCEGWLATERRLIGGCRAQGGVRDVEDVRRTVAGRGGVSRTIEAAHGARLPAEP